MEKTFPMTAKRVGTSEKRVSLGEKTESGGQKAWSPGRKTVFSAEKTGWTAVRELPTDRRHCGLAASKSPLASPAMSMKVFGFK
jgi:hypothetical protein